MELYFIDNSKLLISGKEDYDEYDLSKLDYPRKEVKELFITILE
jgi:hypothetical protein